PLFELEGYEADDILATLAKKAESEGHTVLVVTGDKDALQLVSSNVKVMTTKKGISETLIYGCEEVNKRYGVDPEAIPDLIGLMGDASDNIPGVLGIGEKTASALLKSYGKLEEVLTHLDEISNKKLKESLKTHQEEALLSKSLAMLHFDVSIPVDFNQYVWGEFDSSKVESLFKTLEFSTLLERLLGKKERDLVKVLVEKIKIKKIDSLTTLNEVCEKLSKENEIGLETVSNEEEKKLEGIVLAFKDESLYSVTFKDQSKLFSFENELSKSSVLNELKTHLESDSLLKVIYDGKSKNLLFKNEGIDFKGLSFDVMIAAYLLNPTKASYSFEQIAGDFLGVMVSSEKTPEAACQKAHVLFALKDVLKKALVETQLLDLFSQVEMPLVSILAKMELEGVGLNVDVLNKLSLKVKEKVRVLEREIWNLAGEQFNINSPQQLARVLFEKLRLECGKKTKKGYSTNYSVLIKLVDAHPIVEKILRYRESVKLKSTYIDALPQLVNPKTGRLHTSFNQTGTATGRLSSSNPNLQNIPVRTELGQKIREAFVSACSTDELLVADYSQVELKILAHLSEDENLLKAFAEGKDIHQATSCEVFGVDATKVTPEMRRVAKAVNFGIVYGISPFGLSEQLKISTEEAKSYIEKYFERYPKVQKFIREVISDTERKGFVTTLMRRRRYIPELKNSNYTIRGLGERLAINTLIQGSAADIIKVAMVQLGQELEERNLKSKMILQVHDELVFEVIPQEREIMTELVKGIMERAYSLRANLHVDIAFGKNWSEAKH
ncbi:MAG: DNA polymerase I, partial [Candidatus Subteraquimicrobiales bacterium]|nr:DNA polymerase I [Candidatus Subteraquimicrobiales bacterium]